MARASGYWDGQERVGQLRLSERDSLLVSNVQHGDAWYVRLQLHRREIADGVPKGVPGQKGLILPAAHLGELIALLGQAKEQLPNARWRREEG